MRRISSGWTILAVAAAVLVAGCGGGGGEAAAEAQRARLEALRQTQSELNTLRQELAGAQAELEQVTAVAGAEETPTEGATAPADSVALASRVQQLENEVIDKAESFGADLVGFINENPPVVGQPLSEVQQAALGMKSDEDVILAQTYIDEGGDYGRAIRIYEDALVADPGNSAVEAALARAQELRYMVPERFAVVTKGMTQREVRAALGQVNLRNIREYPDREVVAWFYPTGEGGAAAGVFFRKESRSDDFVVYQTNFGAVPARGGEQEVAAE
jgi:hypothetical protein